MTSFRSPEFTLEGGIPEDANLVPVLRGCELGNTFQARIRSHEYDYNSPVARLQLILIIEKRYKLLYSSDFALTRPGFF